MGGCKTVFTVDTFNLSVAGTITGSSKNKIDDPRDPEHKFLYHASIESSAMMNIYSGNVVLDRKGEDVVTMPEWFEALNTDSAISLRRSGATHGCMWRRRSRIAGLRSPVDARAGRFPGR